MYIIKHPKWKVHRHINQIKKRYTPNTKERVEEPMSVIYDVFEVPRPSSIQKSHEQPKTYPDGDYGNQSKKTKI